MPKKKQGAMTEQFTLRVPRALFERVERVRKAMGVDKTDVIRMLLTEYLPVYEERWKIPPLEEEVQKKPKQ